jgi:hypothetical protein
MSYDPAKRSTRELLAEWVAIMRQLRARDVIRTNNNPIGGIAEAIVAAHYQGEHGDHGVVVGVADRAEVPPPAGAGQSQPLDLELGPVGEADVPAGLAGSSSRASVSRCSIARRSSSTVIVAAGYLRPSPAAYPSAGCSCRR